MKIILTTILLTCSVLLFGQWTRTNVSINGNVTISDLCEHNGSLYAAVSDSGLVRYNETNKNWETIKVTFTPSDNPKSIKKLLSSGNHLYAYVFYPGCASTMIFKSSDNGSNFVADTAGHPRYGNFPQSCKGYPANVLDAFELDGKLINVISGGFYSKYPSDPAWVKTTDPKVTFGEKFATHQGNWFTWSDNYMIHTSIDQGVTWTTPSNTGLPAMFYAKAMNINPTSGRIYVAGNSLSTNEYRLLYSDNKGVKWDSLPINQYLGNSWLNQPQKILGMISKGNTITCVITNSSTTSHPDVLKSTDGGLTFKVDTAGLNPIEFGTVLPSKMLFYKGKLWLALNYTDIYTQDESGTGISELNASLVNFFPNPVTSKSTIQANSPITSIIGYNLVGEVILSVAPNATSHQLDFSTFPTGVYFLNVQTSLGQQTIRVIKN